MKAIVNESVVYNGSIYKKNDIMNVDDAVGASLVKRGVITAFEETEEESVEEFIEEKSVETVNGKWDKEDLKTWKVAELKELATELGIDATGKKEELIEKICADKAEIPVDAIITEEEAIEELPNTSMPE